MTLYRLKNIRAGYGRRTVLFDIDLDIDRNEFIGIIGPNGAGKSTLMKVLTGNLPPLEGEVLFEGKALGKYGNRELSRRMAVVHQSLENLLSIPVDDFVMLGRFPFQSFWRRETAEDLEVAGRSIEETDIGRLRERAVTELSGGEKQLVFIARALTQNRELILLDEPTAHLDIQHTMKIMDVLHNLHSGGTTVITILHDINTAANFCTRIIALKNGEIYADGTPEEVIHYENMERLFNTMCIVLDNPQTGKPYTIPVPEYVRKKFNSGGAP
ncbi:MAG TPA: ABC transporter ATP-binding protein [Spirochaetes bacterium]|nr:ABC transporter ATP-binding protein [Spirochaetota bacterium]